MSWSMRRSTGAIGWLLSVCRGKASLERSLEPHAEAEVVSHAVWSVTAGSVLQLDGDKMAGEEPVATSNGGRASSMGVTCSQVGVGMGGHTRVNAQREMGNGKK